MSNVITFPGRRHPIAQLINRDHVERMVDAALEFAERAIAVLDDLDGDADRETGGDEEPSLAAPERPYDPQIVWSRGADDDRERDGSA